MNPESSNRESVFDFSGRVAVVTGGARGIGRGISEAFLASGADVVMCGRNRPPDDEMPEFQGRRAHFVGADVREPDQAASVIDGAQQTFGRVDFLINNAGGSPAVAASASSPRFFAQVVALNLLAPFYCSQPANALMQGQPGGGSIVNIASVSALRPSPGTAAYGAAKAGLVNLTRTLAVEWAPKVRVNSVAAGLIATEDALDHYGGPAGIARVAETVPLGRMGTPADVAGICLFLCSDMAAYVSGATIEAHGGGERPAFLAAVEQLGP